MGRASSTTEDHLEQVLVGPGDWPPALAADDGAQIVVGGPGTGKTEFLVRRTLHLLDTGVAADDIVVLAFGRRGVADLDRRINTRRPAGVAPVVVTTFHALAMGIVETHFGIRGWARPPQILTGPEQTNLVRALLATEEPGRWSVALRPLLRSATFADEVTDFLLRSSEQLLDPGLVAAMDRDDWRGLPDFMARYRRSLVADHRIDYGMVLAEAAAILRTVDERRRHVLVDEYQDTTTAQVEVLRALSAGGHITVAADPYQSIYSFRGADVANVADFAGTFQTPERPVKRLVLTTSFRTPEAVLRAAERVAGGDIPGAAGPVEPAGGAGRVDIHRFDQQTAEAEWIAAEIVRLHLVDRVPFNDIAVFVRSKRRFVAELSRALERHGIPHEPPDSRTADRPEVRFVLDLVEAATSPDSPGGVRAMRRVLLGPWFGMTLGEVRDLDRHRIAGGLSWAETVRPRFPELSGLLTDARWATGRPADEGAWAVWSGIPQLGVIATDPSQARHRAGWASLLQVLTRWNERNPTSTLVDYSRLLAEERFEATPLMHYTADDRGQVTVTTLHQAKGLEFAVVFVADAVEGVLPDLRVQDTLLGVRHLLPGVPHDSAGYRRFRLQEERRLLYTAMTRASHRVVLTATATGFEEGRGIPSRFLALAAGTTTVDEAVTDPDRHATPVTVLEAEALLRRLVADPDASLTVDDGGRALTLSGEPLRLAAMAVLVEGSRWGIRPIDRFAGFRDRGPDTGLLPDELRLSPSQGEAYELCPRRYALERRLSIGTTESLHAGLGSLIHAVLEAAERAAWNDGTKRSTVEEAQAELDERFDPADFGGEPYATAWRRRAETIIGAQYRFWPTSGRAVALEQRLHAEVDGVPWVGFADRVETADPGTLRIVDYKSGATATSHADAAESLQLGYYVSSAAADPALATEGRVDHAEMWFPYATIKADNPRSMVVRSFDPANLDSIEQRMRAVTAGIKAEDWTPRPGAHCGRCPVRVVCPTQAAGTEGFVA